MASLIEIILRQRKEGKNELDAAGKSLTNFLDVLKKSAAAAAGAGVVFKQAFDLSKQGAEVNTLTESWEQFNRRITHTPDLLDKMTAASNGTISAVDTMKGFMTLTAGVSDEMARKFAAAAPRLMEMAKAANKLNPTLGSTAFLFDSITRGIKRQSPLILDNLGIVVQVDQANRAWAAANDRVLKSMTGEERTLALLTAVMKQGDHIIGQVGGSVDAQADSWYRLEATLTDIVNRYKGLLADALEPTVKILAGDLKVAIDNLTDPMIENAKETGNWLGVLDDLKTQLTENTNLTGSATGAYDGLGNKLREVIVQMGMGAKTQEEFATQVFRNSKGVVHWKNVLGETVVEVEGARVNHIDFDLALQSLFETMKKLAGEQQKQRGFYRTASKDAGIFTRALTSHEEWQRKVTEAQEYANLVMEVDTPDAASRAEQAYKEYTEALEAPASFLEKSTALSEVYNKVLEWQTNRLEDTAEAQDKLTAAQAASRAEFMKTVDSFESTSDEATFYTEAIDDLGTHLIRFGGRTRQQNDDLEALRDAYNRAGDTLHDYEIGLKGAGLEAGELNEKMQEQRDEMARLHGLIVPLESITGTLGETNKQAVWNTDALKTALFEAGKEADMGEGAYLRLAVATGTYSKEQATALLKAAAMQIKIEELGNLIAEGLSIPEAMKKLQQFQDGLDEEYKFTLEADTDEADERLKTIQRKLQNLNRTVTRHRVEIVGGGGIPSVGGGGQGEDKNEDPPDDPVTVPDTGNDDDDGSVRIPMSTTTTTTDTNTAQGTATASTVITVSSPITIVTQPGDSVDEIANQVSRKIAEHLRQQSLARV